MWKLLNVEGSTFMACCIKSGNKFNFVLYDGVDEEGYSETLSDALVMERATNLNKRIQFPSNVVYETLTKCDSVEANLLNKPDDGGIKLKLKFSIDNNPFRFEWHIQRINAAELWENIMVPVAQLVSSLLAQVNELRDGLRKKDIEIQNYKAEGATLRRYTVATQPFDAANFDAEHKDIHSWAKSLEIIGAYLKERAANSAAHIPTTESSIESIVKKVQNDAASTSSSSATNPRKDNLRNRKRKAQEFAKVHIERKALQLRKRPQLQYKDSQSQSEEELAHASVEGSHAKNDELATTSSMAMHNKNESKRDGIECNNKLNISNKSTQDNSAACRMKSVNDIITSNQKNYYSTLLAANIVHKRKQQIQLKSCTTTNAAVAAVNAAIADAVADIDVGEDANENVNDNASDNDATATTSGAGDMDVNAELQRIRKSLADLEEARLRDSASTQTGNMRNANMNENAKDNAKKNA